MSDIAVVYTLTLPGGTIVFNDKPVPGDEDCYFINDIRGLDMGPIRAPMDDIALDDGGLDHDFFMGPMHPEFDIEFVVQSSRVGTTIQTIRNGLIDDLRTALRSALRVADAGTLAWTELGLGAVSLPVRCEKGLETSGVEQKFGTFGLYSPDPQPA